MGRIKISKFRVEPGKKVDLDKWPTDVRKVYKSDDDYAATLRKSVETLDDLQRLQYADDRYAVLVIFQAMDAAGKDGAIRHVLSGVNPQGFQVYGFKQPSPAELDHDFLWRTTRMLPERGRLGIFNRSYYEEVLVVKVHPELLEKQQLPQELIDRKKIWKDRYRAIRELERHLHRNGTRIVKIFLHVSKEEQRKRLLSRVEESAKNWKFSMTDVEERRLWPQYMKAYGECLSETSTDFAPWYVVPADDKPNARLIVARILVETFETLDLGYPKLSAEARRELKAVQQVLADPKGS